MLVTPVVQALLVITVVLVLQEPELHLVLLVTPVVLALMVIPVQTVTQVQELQEVL
jgi:hypothetical protein